MKKTHTIYLIIPLVVLLMLPFLVTPKNAVSENEVVIKPSATVVHTNDPWIENHPKSGLYTILAGDLSDVEASTSLNQANVKVIGDTRTKEVLLNSATQSNWNEFILDESEVVPQRASVPYYGIDDNGAWCSHWWWEGESGGQPKNTPEMHWRTNVSMPVDMSDYNITSVSFNAVINASVDRNIDVEGDTYARWSPSQASIDQYQEFDSVQFYVYISDLDVNELSLYPIAKNKTVYLGSDTLPLYDIEGNIGTFGNQAIIDAINNVLALDPGHNNFTIILGIYIYCEDNLSSTDRDYWDDLRFKSLNLTFTYEKKINQFTSGSWAQDLEEVKGSNVRITGANLNFEYKIDQNWTGASQNSRFLVKINDRVFDPALYFINYVYDTEFTEARSGGFDITEIMIPYENFTLSIQVYLAEDFGLSNNITISITNVNLLISWTEIIPEPVEENWLFVGLFIIAVIGATVLGAYLIAYQAYQKYPVPVRKVRKYRKTLTSTKTPSVGIVGQKASFDKNYNSELKKTDKFLKGSPTKEPVMKGKILDKTE
ncbi:MAG: hypothetical protein ACFE9R_05005 [Candidatus Hermodarchaeota archaeon]